ncbi:MAG TPA: type II toxin-antitoxin system VapC family toxin [Solirubrobacteraceae bacterium]
MDSALAYLDASAFVKLILLEPESGPLDEALDPFRWTSSAVLEVEATLAVRRRQPSAIDAVRVLLGAVRMIDLDADIRGAAGALPDPGLRSLDAIHLATALSLGERCGAFFAYDDRLIAAARAHGLTVTVPRP